MKIFNDENMFSGDPLKIINDNHNKAGKNLEWLQSEMHPYFFITMQEEASAMASLASNLHTLDEKSRLVLTNRDKTLILACLNRPGSLYETLRTLKEREISYAHFGTSYGNLPGMSHQLEVQKFHFDRKDHNEISNKDNVEIPEEIMTEISRSLRQHYPDFENRRFEKLLRILWLNNENYVRISPPERVARLLWLYHQAINQDGVYFDVEEAKGPDGGKELRVLFAVGNPPQKDFLLQTMEVFNRLQVCVKRAYCLTLSNGLHPYFLGTFYVDVPEGGQLKKGSESFKQLQEELYNTQILSTESQAYNQLVVKGVTTGAEASLINAFIGFCHTNLAHNQPERFVPEDIIRAFHNHMDISLQLVKLFKTRFDPTIENRELLYRQTLEETTQMVENYNTGHRFLDEFRRTIFRCCLSFIKNTLKTNYFVAEKHALSFRVDPIYLKELGEEFTSDLPPELPFRVTYFYGRYGSGFHIGFSDIARGGWRTLIAEGRDDYVTCANTIFRENYVLAHTQHLKNKDIYEGGSKMVAVLDVTDAENQDMRTRRLYKLQYGFINAFLDIYVTENGRAKDPRVVDYYGEDEPIELGPDENMHDIMVEMVARQAVKRGYLLGVGIMSSKKVGINHKEYGVTSAGVVKCAEVTMKELGLDMKNDPVTVKFTGGPNGDVAGNGMLLLLERCPKVKINLIVDGTAAMYDPQGADGAELKRILLKQDLEAFEPACLHTGGFILYRGKTRRDGARELYCKVVCTEAGLEEQWISNDEFYREYNSLLFTVPADLFIPAGGRPETVDMGNWHRFFDAEGNATTRAIVEGANSFITPPARVELQKKGIVVMRDATANKCGVISSSYEIIANLLLSEEEFLANKEQYVSDVITILNKRAEDEAKLILRRHKEAGNNILFTEISDSISTEINAHYAKLFAFFQKNSHLCDEPLYRNAILCHLPRILAESEEFSQRITTLPEKIKFAILASEIASSMVYVGDQDAAYEEMIRGHLTRMAEGTLASGLALSA